MRDPQKLCPAWVDRSDAKARGSMRASCGVWAAVPRCHISGQARAHPHSRPNQAPLRHARQLTESICARITAVGTRASPACAHRHGRHGRDEDEVKFEIRSNGPDRNSGDERALADHCPAQRTQRPHAKRRPHPSLPTRPPTQADAPSLQPANQRNHGAWRVGGVCACQSQLTRVGEC